MKRSRKRKDKKERKKEKVMFERKANIFRANTFQVFSGYKQANTTDIRIIIMLFKNLYYSCKPMLKFPQFQPR